MQKLSILAAIAIVVAGTAWWWQRPPETDAAVAPVVPPVLSGDALTGQQIFAAKCAACHGDDAGGVNGVGPSLIHSVYRPAHHADVTFLLAVRNGVRRHHWRFDSMLPVAGLSDADVDMIVRFVRAVQRENGVE